MSVNLGTTASQDGTAGDKCLGPGNSKCLKLAKHCCNHSLSATKGAVNEVRLRVWDKVSSGCHPALRTVNAISLLNLSPVVEDIIGKHKHIIGKYKSLGVSCRANEGKQGVNGASSRRPKKEKKVMLENCRYQ